MSSLDPSDYPCVVLTPVHSSADSNSHLVYNLETLAFTNSQATTWPIVITPWDNIQPNDCCFLKDEI